MKIQEVIGAARACWAQQRERERTDRRNRRRIQDLLTSGRPIRLELGAGMNRLEGWTTIDRNGLCDLDLDLTAPLPFPDGSVTSVYSSHVLEHFLYPRPMMDLLAECRRVLIPGGQLSVAVPNAAIYLDAYANPEGFDAKAYCLPITLLSFATRIDYVNYMAYMAGTHQHLFDPENLPVILREAGFRNVRLREFDPSLDLEGRRYETIYAQGEK